MYKPSTLSQLTEMLKFESKVYLKKVFMINLKLRILFVIEAQNDSAD